MKRPRGRMRRNLRRPAIFRLQAARAPRAQLFAAMFAAVKIDVAIAEAGTRQTAKL